MNKKELIKQKLSIEKKIANIETTIEIELNKLEKYNSINIIGKIYNWIREIFDLIDTNKEIYKAKQLQHKRENIRTMLFEKLWYYKYKDQLTDINQKLKLL